MPLFARILLSICLACGVAYSDLLLRDVAVIDVSTGTVLAKRSILIRGDKIVAVGTAIAEPKDVRIVGGSGKFVIPGLWDMHVHLTDKEQLPMFLSYGITGVRAFWRITVPLLRPVILFSTVVATISLSISSASSGAEGNDRRCSADVQRRSQGKDGEHQGQRRRDPDQRSLPEADGSVDEDADQGKAQVGIPFRGITGKALGQPDGRCRRGNPAGGGKSGLHGNTVPANGRRGRP